MKFEVHTFVSPKLPHGILFLYALRIVQHEWGLRDSAPDQKNAINTSAFVRLEMIATGSFFTANVETMVASWGMGYAIDYAWSHQ